MKTESLILSIFLLLVGDRTESAIRFRAVTSGSELYRCIRWFVRDALVHFVGVAGEEGFRSDSGEVGGGVDDWGELSRGDLSFCELFLLIFSSISRKSVSINSFRKTSI